MPKMHSGQNLWETYTNFKSFFAPLLKGNVKHAHWKCTAKMRVLLGLKSWMANCKCSLRTVLWNYCVIAESDRYFQRSSSTIMNQNESLKRFFSTSRTRPHCKCWIFVNLTKENLVKMQTVLYSLWFHEIFIIWKENYSTICYLINLRKLNSNAYRGLESQTQEI